VRIEGLYIDGFGVFHNQLFEDLPSGLCVFFGDNEAGKSTLHAFVKSILFGFPTSRENQYEPLRGGRHGGSLRLLSDTGDKYIVRREPSRRVSGDASIECPDGAILGEEFLPNLLGAATKDLFESVFAFTLSELQELKALTTGKVKGVIYSAGAGAAGKSLPQIHERLKKGMEELFKARGSKSAINALLRELRDTAGRLKEIRESASRYTELQGELAALEYDIAVLEGEKKKHSLKFERLKAQKNAWEDWAAREAARLELKSLPEIQAFPENAIHELEKLKDALTLATQDFEECEQKRQTRLNERDGIVVDEAIIGQAQAIERLQRGRVSYDDAVRDLPARRQELDGKRKQLERALSHLGPEWDQNKLITIDTSISMRESAREWRNRLDDAQKDEQLARNRAEAAEKALRAAQKVVDDLQERMDTLPEPNEKEEERLSNRRAAIEKVRGLLIEESRQRDRLLNLKERQDDLLAQLPQQEDGARIDISFHLSYSVAALGLLAGAILFGESPAAAIITALVCLIAGFALFRTHRKRRENASERRQSEQICRRLDDTQMQELEAKNKLEEISDNIRQMLRYVGFHGNPADEFLRQRQAGLAREFDALRNWRQAEIDLENAKKSLKDAGSAHKQANESLEKAVNDLTSLERKWAAWLLDASLSDQLTPAGALDVFSQIDTCREIYESVRSLSGRISLMESKIAEYEDAVATVREACGWPTSDTAAGAILGRLSEELGRERDRANRREKLGEVLTDLREKMATLSNRIKPLETGINGLLDDAKASDEADFREKARLHKARQELRDEINRREAALRRLAGPEQYGQFINAMRGVTREELEYQFNVVAEELKSIDGRHKSAIGQRGELKKEIELLESERESSELRLKQQELEAKLRQLAGQWSVLRLAQEILRRAQSVYERERQPDVIHEASAVFKSITDDQYEAIVKPLDKETFDVRCKGEKRLGIEKLSQGTREQLLLAVRLGLVREFGKRQERLPLIMDDVLVNFDYRRARAAARVLHELSETHQVLLFTCHQETLEHIREVAPGTQVFTLSDGTIAALEGQRGL